MDLLRHVQLYMYMYACVCMCSVHVIIHLMHTCMQGYSVHVHVQSSPVKQGRDAFALVLYTPGLSWWRICMACRMSQVQVLPEAALFLQLFFWRRNELSCSWLPLPCLYD